MHGFYSASKTDNQKTPHTCLYQPHGGYVYGVQLDFSGYCLINKQARTTMQGLWQCIVLTYNDERIKLVCSTTYQRLWTHRKVSHHDNECNSAQNVAVMLQRKLIDKDHRNIT
jgi:hypothetical protein